tara:strand:+ start:1603 stop:1962 length:360 start_codon:yes stop_codon:yes gene_type:complete
MINIDMNIRKALELYFQANSSNCRMLSEIVGTSNSTVSTWGNGKAKSIRSKSWNKVFPLIKPYLPKKSIVIIHGYEVYDSQANPDLSEEMEDMREQVEQMKETALHLLAQCNDFLGGTK